MADKAHQPNLIVKACLNMPGVQRETLSKVLTRQRENVKKKKRFWVSCCPVAQRSETCLLPQVVTQENVKL